MSSLGHKVLLDRLYGTIYGNCIGDAIGLLTEFMNKTKAISVSFFLSCCFCQAIKICVYIWPIAEDITGLSSFNGRGVCSGPSNKRLACSLRVDAVNPGD